MKYRADIDGLRAVAIALVVFYHAGFSVFPGGFVGVDIFFVISGYLITGIIWSQSPERFSILEFYNRRIVRIFPALFAVLLASLAAGAFFLSPADYKRLGESVAAASLFSSNFLFWRQAGYFAPQDGQILLHTWSLSVEEQYYAFYPLYLRLLRSRASPRTVAWLTLTLAVASFALACWTLRRDPTGAFYLSPSRAWELLLGGLISMNLFPAASNRIVSEGAALTGALLIVFASTCYSGDTLFPGAAALVPTLGAALVIWAGRDRDHALKRALSARPVVFIGKISYSLYLWHFVLFAFAGYVFLNGLPLSARWLLILLALLISTASWRYIEQPFRRAATLRPHARRTIGAGLAVALASAALGAVLYKEGGLPGRFNPTDIAVLRGADDHNPDREFCLAKTAEQLRRGDTCPIGPPRASGPSFILWGDSQAEVLRAAIADAAAMAGQSGAFAGADGCAPLLETDRADMVGCAAKNAAIADYIAATPSVRSVILAGRWAIWAEGDRYKREERKPAFIRLTEVGRPLSSRPDNRPEFFDGLRKTVERLVADGKQVWIVGPAPEIGYNVPQAEFVERTFDNHRFDIRPSFAEFEARQNFVLTSLRRLASDYPARIIEIHRPLCVADKCEIEIGGRTLYSDDNHLTNAAAAVLSPLFAPVFDR